MTKVGFKLGEVTAHALPEGPVALILTPNAAQCLADIIAVIGGRPATTRRRYPRNMAEALKRVGITYSEKHYCKDMDNRSSNLPGLYFTERNDLGDDGLTIEDISFRERLKS